MIREIAFVALVAVASLGFSPEAEATLIGDTVDARVTNGVFDAINGSAVVADPGVEFFAFIQFPIFRIDVGADTITLLHPPSGSAGLESSGPWYWSIGDLDFVGQPGRQIVDVQLVDSLDFTVNSVSFTADSVDFGGTVSTTGLNRPTAFATYRLITSDASATAVPEPTAATLGVIGLAGIVLSATRRRSRRVN